MLNFRALRTPPHDGAVLIEPAAAHLRQLVRENRTHLSSFSAGLGRINWPAARRRARTAIGVDEQSPLIAIGHQPEFIHPGVWAKHVMAQRLAEAVGGVAVNLVVDNDAPKTLALAVPVAKGNTVELHHVPFAGKGAGLPYEALAGLDGRAIRRIRQEIAALMGASFDVSAMPTFFEGLAAAEGRDFADQMIAGREAAERSFGVTLRDVRVSRAWGGAMLADWVCHAGEFADAYNRALAEYRREEAVRDPDRPIPDLHIAGPRVELPLWACGPGEPRRRLYVEGADDVIRFFAEDEPIGSASVRTIADAAEPADALRTACRKAIRPRALTLTLWARLLVSDLFIHGIGGAKYDRITDKIVRFYYGVEPPAMACVSATLHVPLPRTAVGPDQLTAALRRLRDAQYKPDRWAASVADATPLLAERRRAIERSDTLRLDDGRLDRTARREVFNRIHDLNAQLAAMRPDVAAEARSELARIERGQRQDRIAAGREYFFALYPATKLERLCAALPAAKDL